MDSTSINYKASKYKIGKEYFQKLYASGQLPVCSRGFISGSCSNGHIFASNVICGKEYCEDCGREGSPQHQKRFNRWMPKVNNFESVGFFVFTFPRELWQVYLNKSRLSAFRTALKNKFKRIGFDRGLMRWHLFGDCEQCSGKGCNFCKYTGAGTTFKPHLNVLVEWGYMEDIENNQIMIDLQNFVKDYIFKKHKIKVDKPVIHYSYSDKVKRTEIIHQVKYITRSTFRIYEQGIAEILNAYRITTVWGSFENIYFEDPTENESDKQNTMLDNGFCPDCSKPIQWTGFNHELKYKTLINLNNGKFKVQTKAENIPGDDRDHQHRKSDFRKHHKTDIRGQYRSQNNNKECTTTGA